MYRSEERNVDIMKNGGRNSTSSTPGQNLQPYAQSLSHSGGGGGGGTLMDSKKESKCNPAISLS
jgi:hypothetical protein